jgi:hypothetical protein
MTTAILQDQPHGAKRRTSSTLTTAQLQRIIARWDDGGGVTAAVQAFAQAVPVVERTVWFWLAGRKIHPAMAARIRSLQPPNRREHP